ncbi:hypothetical protein [Aureimonas mangrovi]|uniref:hypothetical protein n=1 Tax=Aureimonas mangrovi TaxID=2758041 RepID=UPI00163DB7E9|nr:hypothetical protein [Aureimonas mangrovi]
MTSQPTRTSIRGSLRNIGRFMEGVRECAAAAEAGRRPSRQALSAIGIDADAYYSIGTGR